MGFQDIRSVIIQVGVSKLRISKEEMSKMVAMSGKSNYYVRPRGMLFYVHDEPQFQKLLPVYKHKEIIEKGYLVTPNIGAHKFHPRKISWNNARKACNSEGGHLAIINSAFEEKILMCMLQERNINEAWVGLHDIFEEGDWVTVTDEAFENTGYTWTPTIANLPDNYGGSQNCGVILKEGGLDDVNCAWTHSFFCEITL
ncbi:PREDICTED: hemolymph lipopolysaccharide-binding protein-like isoform X2 [Dinoponera quadriceps]|uniref:Hemolymph lipopolysaccharide-binding protein-like isoform X2 n=1 Tax=Dinoponera quadriceps TaxID=609295 RepID=A0A6P3XV88_DINQU|nr:PREDICTED: hemolymph lipopolysaccharide-binding protein-like isoform X2 [Dinoponera quadriceps]